MGIGIQAFVSVLVTQIERADKFHCGHMVALRRGCVLRSARNRRWCDETLLGIRAPIQAS